MEFSQRLKELREYHGMTQADIAKCVNLSSAAIGNYERGIREPGIRELVLLADYFEVSVDYLEGHTDVVIPVRKKQIIHYTLTDSIKLPIGLKKSEVEMIIDLCTNQKHMKSKSIAIY